MRIGYLVSKAKKIQQIGKHRKIIDVQGDNIMQETVPDLINEDKVRRVLKKPIWFKNWKGIILKVFAINTATIKLPVVN